MNKESGFSNLSKHVQSAIKKKITSEKPWLLSPFNAIAKKMVGQKKVDDAYWKYFQKPIISADMAGGRLAQKGLDKLTGKKGKLFKDKMLLQTEKPNKRSAFSKADESTGNKEYEVHSLMAPANKAGKVVIPLLGTIKADEMIKKHRENKKGAKMSNNITESDLQKTAAMLTHLKDTKNLLTKEAKATELLYKQAELGQVALPKTYGEYREKVAELLGKDLDVVEEAIKMASSTEEENSFGGLDNNQVKVTSARDSFNMAIMDN